MADDWSGLATRTLDTLLQRREQVDSHSEERRRLEDSALRRFAVAAVAIDEAWTEGARRVEELEREAEQVRDDARARTERLAAEQAAAVLDLLRLRPPEDLAALLGVPLEQIVDLAATAEELVAVPAQRAQQAAEPAPEPDQAITG
jgi:hypothetical protein